MSTRPILLTILAGCLLAAGCGQSPATLKAREEARERLNRVNGQLAYDQAMQAFEAGQFEKARKEINTALALNPDWAEYRILDGRIYLETHRLEKAIQSFQKALELKPDYAEAHYYTGIIYQRWSDDAKAYDNYLAAFELAPDNVSYLLAAAESMVALEQFTPAIQLIESKLAYFEHNASLRHLLGQIALLQDEPDKAAEYLQEARRLNPEEDGLLEELAQAQFAAERYRECYQSVQQLQKNSPEERPDLMQIEARCLAFMDRPQEARSLYLKLSKIRPTDPEVWIELGTLAWEVGDYHRVALCGARVTALTPDRYEGYLLKGLNERHHGNLEESVMFLRQAAARAEETALPHLVLGRVLEQVGDPQGALEAYTEAIRVDPDDTDAHALFTQLSESGQLLTVEDPSRVRNE